jgi:hypothetical protein
MFISLFLCLDAETSSAQEQRSKNQSAFTKGGQLCETGMSHLSQINLFIKKWSRYKYLNFPGGEFFHIVVVQNKRVYIKQ